MPRLHPRMLHHARKIDSLLPLVLQATRDLNSAKNELRWLKEYITSQPSNHPSPKSYEHRLRQVCIDRARGKPLQYIMGSEYFGDLEIACVKGVLIPRQETSTSVTHLINRLHQDKTPLPKHLSILDLCTGTGCIPLLCHYEFTHKHHRKAQDLEVVGVDISSAAINLANKNLQRLVSDGMLHPKPNLQFLQADILATKNNEGDTSPPSLASALQHYTSATSSQKRHHWDILISNPPYISPSAFAHTTTRSVKRYEPLLALVPSLPTSSSSTPQDTDQATQDQTQGDLFYPRLLSIAADLSVKVVLFEVADLEQAKRVAGMAEKQNIWDGVEIWRDDPSSGEMETETGIKVLGTGNGRSVVAYRGEGKDWLCADS
ncbi:S-adenosyl-L-methionine-dependent methyltransferase [Aureobasidium sp. EXF-3400]|nr:S-adenosyl-L-methionine-dependent methyltransferase [Aureobasidium sp. EXF-12344]KAI4779940.1 S-adenosyl-L-methionine-dependent methyltransferase [Aureobasidium sp. EXF-3400]